MKTLFTLCFALLAVTTFGQTDKEKAYELGMQAIQEMESGNIEKSIQLLEQSQKLDPDNPDYPYEIAYAHYLDKDYKAAMKILTKLTKHKEANDRVWQMLGNCHDLNGKPEKAIETYEKGLELFPTSGILYLERGNMELIQEEYNEALYYYEQGIRVEPAFPSNYYWAAKIFLNTNNEVWGLLYGEIFMNLERNSQRTVEISTLLYNTYASEITRTSDTSATVSLCQNMVVDINDLMGGEEFKMHFCMVYEPTLLIAVAFADTIDLPNLDTIRTNFLKSYYDMGHHKTHPNVLFEYQKRVQKEGHLEAYNHWILMKGDEEAFLHWLESNQEKWDQFVTWFTDNPLEVNEKNRFYREQY
ncbi:MAG: tetratricopeptide repeat protein [Leptolyngbya sp. SIO3F4]|nr:tetratricopeptide repeat protein [Leptolyngbya sp. SIO3F4]